MKAVVLAAGDGGRLSPHTAVLPKPLVQVDGRPLIDYTLEGLAGAGVHEVVIVTGYRGGQIHEALVDSPVPGIDIAFVTNARYDEGASLSLQAARTAVGDEPFLLLMADHMLSPGIIRRLGSVLRASPEASLVAADFVPAGHHDIAEATRLAVAPAAGRVLPRVTAIGKHVAPHDALDTGAFLLAPRAWEAVDAAPSSCELAIIFTILADSADLFAVDVSGEFWFDVDTDADLTRAQAMFGARTS